MSDARTPPGFAPPPPVDPGAKRLRLRRSAWWLLPWAASVTAVVTGLPRLFSLGAVYPLVVLDMMLPWIAGAAVLSVIVSYLGRQGVLILFALPGAVLTTWPVVEERWPVTATYPQGLPLRVLTANLYLGNATHLAALRGVLDARADVVCLQEVTHGWAVTLEDEALTTAYPFRHVHPEDSPFGIALLSRLPVSGVEVYDLAGLPQLRATVEVEGAPVELHCVHLMPPLTPELFAVHRRGGDELGEMLAARPAAAGPLVLAGDFNSTPYNRLHLALTATLEDAWIPGEDGFGHTAPATPLPIPLMRVDHVYVGAGARSMGGAVLPAHGSDHRALVVNLAIPRQGSGLSSMDGP